MDVDQRRRARNEVLFREVNERIVELESGLVGSDQDDSLAMSFVCECPREDCNEMIEMTRDQYEEVRSHPRRFFVLPGHEDGDIARLVERQNGYCVVEKVDGAGAMTAEEDPRT